MSKGDGLDAVDVSPQVERSTTPDATVPVRAEGLGRSFGDVVAFFDVAFTLAEGEFLTIVGPSGCGKSSLLNVVAGLLEPTSGRISVYGDSHSERVRHVGYMFQRDQLLAWRRIRDNVAIALEVEGVRKRDARARAQAMLVDFGLDEFADSYPSQLSGGMRQRVALMRTLISQRPLLLLDEPFGALDALTRTIMQEWLLDIWDRARSSVVFITHDIDEAIFLSDRILVMTARPGRIKAEIRVELPRPRSARDMTTPAFVSMKQRLVDLLHDEGIKASFGGLRQEG
jgi:ABC-type nitrate/sulfonate/bicarbonate transport system ATPase subunit